MLNEQFSMLNDFRFSLRLSVKIINRSDFSLHGSIHGPKPSHF